MKKLIILFTINCLPVVLMAQTSIHNNFVIERSSPSLHLKGSNGVINFNSGDVTLTNTSNTLTIVGGVLALPANGLLINSINHLYGLTDTISDLYYTKANIATYLAGKQDTGVVSVTYPGAGIPLSTGSAWGTSITNNSVNWDTAYAARLRWSGTATGLTAATGRTSLGATTVGSAFFTLANPSAIRVPIIQTDNTITATATTGTGNVVLSASPTLSGTVALGTGSLTMTGSLAATGSRVTKGWFTDLEVTNLPTVGGLSIHYSPTFTGLTSLPITTEYNGVRIDSVLVPFTGATTNLNLGANDVYLSGDVASSVTPANHGYFNNITLTNPLRGNVRSDSILYEEGDTIPGMFLSEGYDNFLVYNALNAGILAESFGVTVNDAVNSTSALSDGIAYYQAFYLKMEDTLTGAKLQQYTQGNFTADNHNELALYTYDAGVITQVAISANSGDIWKATSRTTATIPFGTPYYATKGLYFLGFIYNTSDSPATQAPVLMSTQTNYTLEFLDFGVYVSEQTELAASVTLSGATNLVTPKWFIIY